MAEAKEIPAGTYNLKLGETFQNNEEKSAYHTLRFDFKPKSVASESETYLAFGGNGDVQVAVPGEGDSLTIYKGSQKAVKQDKDCLLFFDPDTGELRLEKLTSNISVKKTRDTDETSVNFLRMEIQKLRGGSHMDDEEMDDGRSTTSSSSCSTSDSSDQDSDSDSSSGGALAAPNTNESKTASNHFGTSSEEEDANNSCSGEDDDDLQDALEQELNSGLGPLIGCGEMCRSEPPKVPAYTPTQNFHSNTKKVLDDLQLSESSDED